MSTKGGTCCNEHWVLYTLMNHLTLPLRLIMHYTLTTDKLLNTAVFY